MATSVWRGDSSGKELLSLKKEQFWKTVPSEMKRFHGCHAVGAKVKGREVEITWGNFLLSIIRAMPTLCTVRVMSGDIYTDSIWLILMSMYPTKPLWGLLELTSVFDSNHKRVTYPSITQDTKQPVNLSETAETLSKETCHSNGLRTKKKENYENGCQRKKKTETCHIGK